MIETYYAGSYWANRIDSKEDCAKRAELLFQGLAKIDPFFSRWFLPGRSLKQALKHEFRPDAQTFREFFAKKKHQGMMASNIAFGAWNGRPDDNEGCSVGLSGGFTTLQFPGICTLNIPSTGPFADRIITVPAFSQVLRVMASAWDPDWGIATSDAHLLMLDKRDPAEAYTGWIMYFARRRGTVPPLPAPVRVESVEDLGTLIVLTPERFTASNPAHVELAARVRGLLDEAGLLRPHPPP